MTAPGLTAETLAWILFASAVLAFLTGQHRLAFGLGLPAVCLAGIEWLLPAPSGVGVPAATGVLAVLAALPAALPTFMVVFAVGLGLHAARGWWRRESTAGRVATFPYPDIWPDSYPGYPGYPGLVPGRSSPGDGVVHCAGEPLGRWDGRQWDGLCARLAILTREFLGYVVPKPGQPARIDLHDPDVEWMIDSLLGAADLVVGASGDDEPQVLAAAIREVERRWLVVRSRRDWPHRV